MAEESTPPSSVDGVDGTASSVVPAVAEEAERTTPPCWVDEETGELTYLVAPRLFVTCP